MQSQLYILNLLYTILLDSWIKESNMSKELSSEDYAEKEKKLLEKVISTKQYKDLQSDEKQKLIEIVENC